MQLLLVEPSPEMRRLLKKLLELDQHEVIVAADGNEAWEIYQKNPVRMVLSEWITPGMDGLELALRIRGLDRPGYTYIIMMSAREKRDRAAQALAAGADDLLQKPIDRTDFRWRLRSGLRMLHLEESLDIRIQEIEAAKRRIETVNRRIQKDLDAAAEMQRALLPSAAPIGASVKCSWLYQSSDELGGDSLNLFPLSDDNIGMYVADVSGHGVAAALLAVTLHRTLTPVSLQHSMLTTESESHPTPLGMRPHDVIEMLNRRFPMDAETGQYFTMCYGCLNYNSGRFLYSLAGHPQPFLIRPNGETKLLSGGGLPVGFLEESGAELYSVDLEPGDRICIYSDGVSEAADANGEQFGDHQLLSHLAESHGVDVQQCLDQLMEKLFDWTDSRKLRDDVSAIVFEYTGSKQDTAIATTDSNSEQNDSLAPC